VNTPGNPWLSIPAADYEAHMADPAVRQTPFLDAVFARALAAHRPQTVAILGCATGTGLGHLAARPRRGPAVARLASGREFACIEAERIS
jgi:hypothetical protein